MNGNKGYVQYPHRVQQCSAVRVQKARILLLEESCNFQYYYFYYPKFRSPRRTYRTQIWCRNTQHAHLSAFTLQETFTESHHHKFNTISNLLLQSSFVAVFVVNYSTVHTSLLRAKSEVPRQYTVIFTHRFTEVRE